MGNSDLLSFAMLMHAGVRDPFYQAAATPLISSFLPRALPSRWLKEDPITSHTAPPYSDDDWSIIPGDVTSW